MQNKSFSLWVDLSWIVFVLRQDVIELLIRVLLLLPNDISKVMRVFPEDQNDDNLENERDVGKQFDKSTQLVLIASILFVFLGCTALNHEKSEEVVDPGYCDQKNKATERLSRNVSWVVEYVDGCCSDCQAQETIALEHLDHSERQEYDNNELCDSKPRDRLDFVGPGERIDIVVKGRLQLLLLLIILMVGLLVCLIVE